MIYVRSTSGSDQKVVEQLDTIFQRKQKLRETLADIAQQFDKVFNLGLLRYTKKKAQVVKA